MVHIKCLPDSDYQRILGQMEAVAVREKDRDLVFFPSSHFSKVFAILSKDKKERVVLKEDLDQTLPFSISGSESGTKSPGPPKGEPTPGSVRTRSTTFSYRIMLRNRSHLTLKAKQGQAW